MSKAIKLIKSHAAYNLTVSRSEEASYILAWTLEGFEIRPTSDCYNKGNIITVNTDGAPSPNALKRALGILLKLEEAWTYSDHSFEALA